MPHGPLCDDPYRDPAVVMPAFRFAETMATSDGAFTIEAQAHLREFVAARFIRKRPRPAARRGRKAK